MNHELKLPSLDGRQNAPDLLAGITPDQLKLRTDELPQIVSILLGFGDDFSNLFALFRA